MSFLRSHSNFVSSLKGMEAPKLLHSPHQFSEGSIFTDISPARNAVADAAIASTAQARLFTL